ncbi:breast cancer anti-estrogen resistance protein 1 isoform X1 [Latimeria chalumnae]|uniref:breast cancer anti-estrogen resistance protein 1 isoform X1 n=1 Tax=Latimeria chalumnae TaxID=7897 RepID=UPI0003C1B31A|nr:PREDICTED: breast cancer anti-estrogen resistance protein 1 isoform X1 [Latimeria chalumnae]|eukprot:XP_006002463.1 PREDICTED: breast cancer anti-estrogen resistance protein 1 isoform X1 [Latimeria chalumnae]
MNFLNVLAKALYDNVAESPDELSFRKGDIMTVLERNTQGLDGWWLCSLHGRKGIVPGNRLKILVGMYDKKQSGQGQPPQSPLPCHQQGVHNVQSPASQYTSMYPAYPAPGDNVYMMPPSNKGQQSLYQVPPGLPHQTNVYPVPPSKQPQHGLYPKQLQNPQQDIYQVPSLLSQGQDIYQIPPGSKSPPQDIYQVPPSVGLGQDIYQVPPSVGPGQDIYQVPPSAGPGQDIYQVPPSMSPSQDIYQVPPSLEKRNWEGTKPQGKVVVPTRVGQVYVYDPPKPELDEYDVPRHLTSAGTQEIYDVPPHRGGLANQCSQEVYDTPPMAVKGPNNRDVGQEIYDVPPSVEKTYIISQQSVYDFPPSVSKDVPDGAVREETYDVPPAFAPQKTPFEPVKHPGQTLHHSPASLEQYQPEDVYDVPPPAGKVTDAPFSQEIYDVPPSLKKPGGQMLSYDIYDVPRDLHGQLSGGKVISGDDSGDYIYDVPPQVDRDVKSTEEGMNSVKRLSSSSTGSTRSNVSSTSLDLIPVKESTTAPTKTTGKELNLDLDVAMEMLAKRQQNVEGSVSYLMSFISSSWRSPEQMEANVENVKSAVEKVKDSIKDLLEFARGAVNNAVQATDRTLYPKLSKQLHKMEEVYQVLLKHSQALDNCNWALSVLAAGKQNPADDLDRFVMNSRGIPDDTKQLASFLHGNASLLFKRTKQQSSLGDNKLNSSHTGLENVNQVANNNNISTYQTGLPDKSNIQSRPLPLPPKLVTEESPDAPYENNESGWMEDYDYVHLQGKEEFEKTQKELLEKGNIIRQGKGQLEQQQLKQFERLEHEVSQPIDNDVSNWNPPQQYAQVRSKLSPSDRQLLLFYSEQCEANITTLTNAIDAFFTAISTNQPPKIFVAHSKFVILSAHKLVFIGDTLSRQAKAQEIRNKVTHYSNLLCEMLKKIVETTKSAALQYPSPTAANEMMERVKELSNSTLQFRMVLGQLAAM